MPQDLQAIVQRMVEAGESEENIASVIQHFKAQPAPPTSPEGQPLPKQAPGQMLGPAGMVPKNRRGEGFGSMLRMIRDNPVESAATAGALAAAPFTGGLSVPAAMGLTGLASAGGAGYALAGRQLAGGKPETIGGNVATMAKQGAANAAGEGIGRGIVAGANVVIPKVLKGILRPGKAVQQEFGDVVDVMRREKIPVGGSETAGARMSASANDAKQAIARAEAAGASKIAPKEVTKELKSVADVTQQRKRLGKPDETGDVIERGKNFYRENLGGITLTDAQAMKQQAQKEASTAFRAQDRGNVINETGALADKAIAQGLRGAIETRVPQVRGINTRTQNLMGLQGALEDAEFRSGAGPMTLNPMSWLGTAVPGLGSRGAFAVDAAAQGTQAPLAKLFRQALLSLLAGESPDQ